jgi:NADPH-dependent 2,4-dienoyl-CoA reductase/sulfur reductase-like enzyme
MTHDLIIIGAGPAGMAAALSAAKFGLKTALIDESPRPGGQIYRNIGHVRPEVAGILGPDYWHGGTLAASLGEADIDRHFATTVWDIAPGFTVSALSRGRGLQLHGPQLIAATGAMERASPIPGWTLSGVLNAGAAQIALKSGGSVPSGRIVLAGGGPLLLLVACQLLSAGAVIAGIVETSPAVNRRNALRHLPGAMMAPKLLAKGLAMMARLKRAGVPWFTGASELAVEGGLRAEALRFSTRGRSQRLEADIVLLHHGVVPNTQISRLLSVDHHWNETQRAFQPHLDAFGETSLAGFRIAGDGGGIAGALAAEAGGTLAALGVAEALGRITLAERNRLAQAPQRALAAQRRIRPFLDALYRPPDWIAAPLDDTIVCRCEEVTARQIAEMARIGCLGPNQTKFFSRCGMGPCQGRICGLSVTGILARENGATPEATGAYGIRSPLKPVPLAAIAELSQDNRETMT